MRDAQMRDAQMCGCGRTTCTDSKGKHPIGAKWQERASTDPATVATWARHHRGCNWGTATGIKSDLYVVDLDLGKDGEPLGERTWTELFGPIPDTHQVRTGSGAMQLYFRYPHRPQADGKPWRNTAKLIGPGIDTRGEGGQCVLPGSVSGKGPYELIADRPLLAVPDALLDHIETAERKVKDTPKPNNQELRAAGRLIASAIGATEGLHPYVAKAFDGQIAKFQALTGSGNGRTDLLGGARYLNGMASDPASGLTERMIRDAYTKACHVNGYADLHPDWEYQLNRALANGRGETPQNWVRAKSRKHDKPRRGPSEVDEDSAKGSEYYELHAKMPGILASGDQEQIDALVAALGPEAIGAFRARTQRGTPAATADTPPQTSRAAAPATEATVATIEPQPSPVDVQFGDNPTLDRTGRTMVEVGSKDRARDFSATRKDVQLALGVSNATTPWLYEHGEEMVVAGRGKLQRVDIDLLTSRLADRIEFMHWGKDENQMPIPRPSNPPTPVIKAILADRANIGLPEVDRIAHTPFYGPDATLQRAPGYHAGARTLYVPTPGIDIPDIPDNPTDQQIDAAVELILVELLGDFPFTGPAELAGAVALGVTPFVRTMIDGPTPLFALDAPEPRTGKGLLMEMLLTPSSGRQYTVTPAPTELNEWNKAIVASLRTGPVAAIFDNANARIDSGALASAVSAYPSYESRLLGFSDNAKMPLPAVWVTTGNNIVCSTEIAGRVVRIRLDARAERPGERTGFRHQNLRRWATAHQGEIIAAFLTMVAAWIAAGQPRATDLPTMGGFEDWIGIVGSILAFHGIGGLLDNRKQLTDYMTDDSTDWGGLIAMMVTETAEAKKRAAEAEGRGSAADDTPEMDVTGDPPIVAPASTGADLATAPPPATGGGGVPATSADPAKQQVGEWTASQLVSLMHCSGVQSPVDFGTTENTIYMARKLAKALRAHRDRRFGDHTLRMRIHGTALWSLEKMT